MADDLRSVIVAVDEMLDTGCDGEEGEESDRDESADAGVRVFREEGVPFVEDEFDTTGDENSERKKEDDDAIGGERDDKNGED